MSTYPFEPVTRAMAAKILKISLNTLDKHVKDGILPPPRPLGNGRQLYWLPEVFFPCIRRGLQSGGAEKSSSDMHVAEAATPTSRRTRRSGQPMSDRLKKLNA